MAKVALRRPGGPMCRGLDVPHIPLHHHGTGIIPGDHLQEAADVADQAACPAWTGGGLRARRQRTGFRGRSSLLQDPCQEKLLRGVLPRDEVRRLLRGDASAAPAGVSARHHLAPLPPGTY